ncbi:uncharacterized protein LOC133409242 [Phycodurus eques]|uniref:uncharacterized protein LOC133409242 n=1 Tax=Phycodurus eques TaxID=693459 RepID=UPI002ACDCA72|nr:uncharacterized protein LOC133409242 [Phycodurus eques]
MKMGTVKRTASSSTLMVVVVVMMMMGVMETSGQELGDMWTTAAPPDLNGRMITLFSNGGGVAGGVSFYPPYFSFRRNNAWKYQTGNYPTRAYPTGAYPTGNYPTRAYPTRDYPTGAYPTGAYPTGDYPTGNYPTRAYPTRDYPTRAYPTRAYPTRAYPTRQYPTRAYPTREYPTGAYPTGAYPTGAYPTRAYPTRNYPSWSYPPSYTASSNPGWTTEAPTTGVTVCLRYLFDVETSSPRIFTVSPSSPAAFTLSSEYDGSYRLSWSSSYWSLRLKANVRMWPGIRDDLWTRLCLTVDTVPGVVQVFSGAYMSVRKMAPNKYVWSGEPVIDMTGMDGQVTDLQMWDYPLSYNTILNYMTRPGYGWPTGSVLTWSNIRYSLRGRTLVEEAYQHRQAAKSHKSQKRSWKNKKEAKEQGIKSFE